MIYTYKLLKAFPQSICREFISPVSYFFYITGGGRILLNDMICLIMDEQQICDSGNLHFLYHGRSKDPIYSYNPSDHG